MCLLTEIFCFSDDSPIFYSGVLVRNFRKIIKIKLSSGFGNLSIINDNLFKEDKM